MMTNNATEENIGVALLNVVLLFTAVVLQLWPIASDIGLLDILARLNIISDETAEFLPWWGCFICWPLGLFLGFLSIPGVKFADAAKGTMKVITALTVCAIPLALLAGVIAIAIYYGLRIAFFVFLLIGVLFIPGFLKKCGGS